MSFSLPIRRRQEFKPGGKTFPRNWLFLFRPPFPAERDSGPNLYITLAMVALQLMKTLMAQEEGGGLIFEVEGVAVPVVQFMKAGMAASMNACQFGAESGNGGALPIEDVS
ncbi:hypothetical protein L7F22_006938 [Adiantum nelumboides]|nr:hypothetical protein [Adiantum nelumboides]